MRFYLDEDLSQVIATLARRRGLDVTSSHEVQYRHDGIVDAQQLALAAAEGRCLVTKNGPDFSDLTAAFMEQALPHAGVLVVPSSLKGNEFGAIVERLMRWNDRYPDGLPPYFFGYL
ncbi:MAG TPA: DUF5615 family PIN-like protein [Dehalococcoidia bacterium]|nr:DUF5615 family PIN-like protein [Dehalococcoidia bacterium]